MGERERYEPGAFSWVDLGTDDQATAKVFYLALFSWDAVDTPMGDAGVYTIVTLGGRDVGAIYQRAAGPGPPAWLSYITVDDVDAVAEQARAAGATAVGDPFDVFDAGRMTVVEDPTGAHVALWQPRDRVGATVVNEPGALCLNQLNTSDPPRATTFYTEVFGWRFEHVGTDDQPYWGIFNGPALNGGMMPLPLGSGAPSHWIVYFATADLDATVAHVAELGGRVLEAPMTIASGRIAVAADPQGASFALFEGRLDP